jgi:hypothetical protein
MLCLSIAVVVWGRCGQGSVLSQLEGVFEKLRYPAAFLSIII